MIVCIGANHLTQKTKETMRISVCGFQRIKSALSGLGLAKYSQHGLILSLVKRTS